MGDFLLVCLCVLGGRFLSPFSSPLRFLSVVYSKAWPFFVFILLCLLIKKRFFTDPLEKLTTTCTR